MGLVEMMRTIRKTRDMRPRAASFAAAGAMGLAVLAASSGARAESELRKEGIKLEGEVNIEGKTKPASKKREEPISDFEPLMERMRFGLGEVYPIERVDGSLIRVRSGESGELYKVTLNPTGVKYSELGSFMSLDAKKAVSDFKAFRGELEGSSFGLRFMYFQLDASYSELMVSGDKERLVAAGSSYVPDGSKESGYWKGHLLTLSPSIGFAMSMLGKPAELTIYSEVNYQSIDLSEQDNQTVDKLVSEAEKAFVLGSAGIELNLRDRYHYKPTVSMTRAGVSHLGGNVENMMGFLTGRLEYFYDGGTDLNASVTPYLMRLSGQYIAGATLEPISLILSSSHLKFGWSVIGLRGDYETGSDMKVLSPYQRYYLQIEKVAVNIEMGLRIPVGDYSGPHSPSSGFQTVQFGFSN